MNKIENIIFLILLSGFLWILGWMLINLTEFPLSAVFEAGILIGISFLFYFLIDHLNNKYFLWFRLKTDFFYLVFSLMLTTYLFGTLPRTFFDDSGFTLRYLDNFKSGYFYTFNPEDGPVFGISGFLNLLFCFLISFFTGLPSKIILLLSNTLGLFFSSWFLLKILNEFFKNQRIIIPVWLMIFLSSKHLLIVSFTGMETPFHLALLLGATWFMIKNKISLAFLFISLSVVSKLDAVASGVVLLIYLLLSNLDNLKSSPGFKSFIKKAIIFAFLPLLIFLITTLMIFGSPLPQSAYAKVFYYQHPETSLSPFLEPIFSNTFTANWMILCLFLSIVMFALIYLRKKRENTLLFLPVLIMLSLIALYHFYNPAEKMLWYYAIPSFFLSFQIFLVFGNFVLQEYRKIRFISLFFAIVSFMMIRIDIDNSLKWMKKTMNIVENERILIGSYLGEISNGNQILLSKHGHISRFFKGYVIDNSGLNSKLATDYHLNTYALAKDFSPDFMINHAYSDFISTVNKLNYRLNDAFYDLTLNDNYEWLLFKKVIDSNEYKLIKIPDRYIVCYEKKFALKNVYRVRGKKICVEFPEGIDIKALRLIYGAIKFQIPYELILRCYSQRGMKEIRQLVKKIGSEGEISRFVQCIIVEIPEDTFKIEIEVVLDKVPVTMIDPYLEVLSKDSALF